MGSHYDQLSLAERQLIARLWDAKLPVRQIAERLGRHRSTIHRELRRNWFDDGPWLRGYFGLSAQQRTTQRRRRHGKLYSDPDLVAHVVAKLELGWSPEQIVGRLRLELDDRRLCHESIYRFIYGGGAGPDHLKLWQLLPSRRRKRRVRYARRPRGAHIPACNTIEQRPPEIGERSSFGHWECDLVMFRKEHGQRNIVSLIERQSRYAVLDVNPTRHSMPIMTVLTRELEPLPPNARRTITFDRGTEFASFAVLERGLGVHSYFCKPQAPWQKGSVENFNGRVRRHLPLDSDVSSLTTGELRVLAERLNATPRKCLGYHTPAEAFRTLTQQSSSGLLG